MKNNIVLIAIASFLLMPFTASAATLKCSIHPPKSASASQLAKFAKISQDDARKAALSHLKLPSDTAAEGELEMERDCLVYSFDVNVSGRSGVEEIWVDAGNGKVISSKHENSAKEAAEKVLDRDQSKKSR